MKEIVFEQQSNFAISADNIRISVIEMHQIECLVPVIMTEEGSASTCKREGWTLAIFGCEGPSSQSDLYTGFGLRHPEMRPLVHSRGQADI